jgi:hypothetical protein
MNPRYATQSIFAKSLFRRSKPRNSEAEKYPNAIDPSWIEEKQVPELIRLNDFYESHDDMYVLYFRYPGDFWDNIWGYQCGPQQPCAWSSHDIN